VLHIERHIILLIHINSFKSELCGTFSKKLFRMPVCQFLINFLLLKVELCFGKAQNTIRPFQNLLEPPFFRAF